MKKTMIIHDTLRTTLNLLSSNDAKVALIEGILAYGFDEIEPNFNSNELNLVWTLYKPALDANIKRYNKAVESGKKSSGNKNSKKKLEQETKPNEPVQSEQETKPNEPVQLEPVQLEPVQESKKELNNKIEEIMKEKSEQQKFIDEIFEIENEEEMHKKSIIIESIKPKKQEPTKDELIEIGRRRLSNLEEQAFEDFKTEFNKMNLTNVEEVRNLTNNITKQKEYKILW